MRVEFGPGWKAIGRFAERWSRDGSTEANTGMAGAGNCPSIGDAGEKHGSGVCLVGWLIHRLDASKSRMKQCESQGKNKRQCFVVLISFHLITIIV